jgi:hypothetical protein
MASIFLSHSSLDKDFARRLAVDLRARGIRVWLDEADIGVGDSLIGRLEQAIDETDYLAVLLSENSVQSEWVLREVRMALHREISGKRVVVLPLLYHSCNIPGFLRDKIYADFRNEANYEVGITQLVKRVGVDRLTNPALERSLHVLEEIPFTKAWRLALQTGTLSSRFLRYVKEILGAMTAERGTWDPATALSYAMFVVELTEKAPLGVDGWNFLKQIVEDSKLNLGLRYSTLGHMCTAGIFLLSEGLVELPRFSAQAVPAEDRILTQSVRSLLDPVSYDSMGPDIHAPVRLLATLWRFGDPALRRMIIEELHSYIGQYGATHLNLTHALEAVINRDDDITDLLLNLRKSWAELPDLSGEESEKNRAMHLLRQLAEGKDAVSVEDIVRLFREASEREESNQFGVYALLFDLFSQDFFNDMRRRRGDKFTYALLVNIIIDPDIEITLSCLALTVLVLKFGAEGLLLDDRIPERLFTTKRKGRAKNVSLIDLLCETLSSSEGDDVTDAVVLITITTALEDRYRKQLMKIVRHHAKASDRVSCLDMFFRGQMTLEELEGRLKGQNST